MAYTVLARKYRPQRFAELVGQEHVARTLRHAIEQDRVAHAFLFTGVRGVGKTSTARLLAKALNCEEGPRPEPCNACDPCREIAEGTDLDVLEIDGASHNRVEDVRQLQEQLPYRPARDRFKIVIVDEVHMLSSGAFNALLKTLEEPPPHVKFIFATTEAHKVPITIRSRCQRYDFRLIPRAVVAERVREILGKEGIEADEAAVSLVAQEAAGSMRDALTLLDQIVAFAGERLEGEAIARALGVADQAQLARAVHALVRHEPREALEAVADFAARGVDMLQTARRILGRVRDLVVLSVAPEADDLLEMTSEERREASSLIEGVQPVELQRLFRGMTLVVDEVARSTAPRMALEMGLVRLASQPPLRDLSVLLARLEQWERRGRGGPLPGGGEREGHLVRARKGLAPRSVGREPSPRTAPSTDEAEEEGERAPASGAESSVPSSPPPSRAGGRGDAAEPGSEPPAAWEAIVERLATERPALAAQMEHVTPLRVDAQRVELEAEAVLLGEGISAEEREALIQAAEAVFGTRPELRLHEVERRQGPTLSAWREVQRRALRDSLCREALEHPAVARVRALFDAPEPSVDPILERGKEESAPRHSGS